MRNKVTKIFSDMTDEELVLVIDEMRKTPHKVLSVRMVLFVLNVKWIHAIVGGNVYEHLTMVQVSIMKEAAYRFTPTMDELTHNV